MADTTLANLPLEWIRAYEAAGRTGSFTAAARETGLTQAAISQRILNLEGRLGAQLFVRQARGVALTVEGEAWLPYVSAALATLRESSEELFGTRQSRITVSASASVIELWLAPRLEAAGGDFAPELAFSTLVLEPQGEQAKGQVKIRYGGGNRPEHYKRRLFSEALSPVCAPGLAKAASNWQDLPRIALSGPRAGWQEWVRQTGDSAVPVPLIRFDSLAAALAAAEAGAGVLLASLPLCRQALDGGSLVRLSSHVLTPQETYWMVAHRNAVSRRDWAYLTERFCE
ncbi:LysR family transcriptional regulator [Salaquimonas pukyongi]|uniref:LysR family transcriptional regulator n=1 Tax=Salaquimonas pukyongi TaxID=2712698 RepID=UPI00096B9473|nr:LysR family transcriptional regulator [Salaquimonas pukyongi]